MLRTSLKTLTLATVLALAACSGDGPTGPGNPSPGLGVVSITNEANVPIIQVNIADCDDPTWGANRLNGSEVIAPGASRTWSVPAGCWDVRVRTGTKVATWFDRMLTVGGTLNLALSSAANELFMGAMK